MAQWSANINVMIKAARHAGRGLMRDFGDISNLQILSKAPDEFVTRASIKSEENLYEDLKGARPTYGWLVEKGDEIKGEDPTRRWIVDALAGARNFKHGLHQWCITIALEHKGQIVAAVIFSPSTEEIFVSEKGGGSWLNDRRIRTSTRNRNSEMMFATHIAGSDSADLPQTLKDLAHIMPTCVGVRNSAVPALDLAYVAAGRYDGYWARHRKAWETGAGTLLVKEAGGLIEAIADKDADPIETGEILAASEETFANFAKMVRGA